MTKDEVIVELAEKRIKLEKAEAHAVTAQQYAATAQEEVQFLEKELERLVSPPTPSRSAASLLSFQKMAETLNALQSSAQLMDDGSVKVDSTMMAQLASYVSDGAKAASPVKRRRVAPPWLSEADRALQSVDEESQMESQAETEGHSAASHSDCQHFQLDTPKQPPPKRLVLRTFTGGVSKLTPVHRLKGKAPTKLVTKAEMKRMKSRLSSEAEEEEGGAASY